MKKDNQTQNETASGETPCSVPYSNLPLESDEPIMCENSTTTFKDGRTVSVASAADQTLPHSEGLWVSITKPLDNGDESLLKFRITDEAALVLCKMLNDALLPNA